MTGEVEKGAVKEMESWMEREMEKSLAKVVKKWTEKHASHCKIEMLTVVRREELDGDVLVVSSGNDTTRGFSRPTTRRCKTAIPEMQPDSDTGCQQDLRDKPDGGSRFDSNE